MVILQLTKQSVDLTERQIDINEIAMREFGSNNFDLIPINNLEIDYSELCMHTKMAGKTAIFAVVNRTTRYAYIFSNDGGWVHGLSYRQGIHSVSVC